MPFPSASIVFGWPICDNRHKKWKIRTILAINNCSMRQQALIDTREIWRARKLRKSSSRRIQMQLLVLEAFLNFPKCFITWLTHTWSMTQLFCWMISGEKYPPLIFNGRKTPPACKIGCCAIEKSIIYAMNWTRTQNRPWNMIQLRRCVKEKQKKFSPFVFIGKNIKARMLMMFRTTRSIAMRSWRTFIQTSTPKVTT